MAIQKVPTIADLAKAKTRKRKSGDLLDNAKHYRGDSNTPIRKMNLKTGVNQVFEMVRKIDLKALFKQGPSRK